MAEFTEKKNPMEIAPSSAGAWMNDRFIRLTPNMTVGESFEHIRAQAARAETLQVCYVTGEQDRLIGYVTMVQLLRARNEQTIRDMIGRMPVTAQLDEDQESVARKFRKYDYMVMAVLDAQGRLAGIITADAVMDVLQAEATEDMEKMAAMLPTEKPYLSNTTFETWKSRFPWLLLLMLSSTLTAQIIAGFEDALSACMVLAAFITMLSDTGGNSGAQSSVEVIRALSLQEISFRDLPEVLWKEVRVALLSGVTLAAVNFAKMMLVDRMLFANPAVTPYVAMVVSLTVIVTVLSAKVLGALFPMAAQKMGIDPAVIASPFITTVVDALSLLIYFGFAVWLLGL